MSLGSLLLPRGAASVVARALIATLSCTEASAEAEDVVGPTGVGLDMGGLAGKRALAIVARQEGDDRLHRSLSIAVE